MDRLSQDALNTIIINHRKYIKGIKGGTRASIKFKDISGLSMKGHDMSNADFSGSCLNDVDLSEGDFRSVSFFACDMKNVNMSKSDFSQCDFRGACIINADLSGANLKNTDFRQGLLMSYADNNVIDAWGKTGKARLEGSMVRYTNLSGVKAAGANFSDSNMSGVQFKEADLQDCIFEGANLTSADMTGCNLMRAIVKDAVIDNLNLYGAVGNQSELEEMIRLENERSTLEEDGVSLNDLVDLHTKWIDTNGAEGQQLNLSEYDLTNQTDLKDFPLTVLIAEGSKFTGLYLAGVKMESSVLDKADFRDCIAPDADFRGSSFKGAVFTRADMRRSNFGSLRVKRPDGSEITQKVDLSGARMAYAKLDNTNFKDANLSGVDFTYASLKGCNFTDCDLEGAIFDHADMDEDTQSALK